MKLNRVKSIELWRLFFAVLVLIWHTRYLPWFYGDKGILLSGHAADFFLLLSGFLMAKHAEKPLHGTLGEDSWYFILHKIGRFYPMYLLAIVFSLVSNWIATGNTLTFGALSYYVWDLLLLRPAGLQGSVMTGTAIGASWYLMAMILAMAVLYPMLRTNKDVFLHIVAPLVTVFLYGWFSQIYGCITLFTVTFEHGVSTGLLRAIAGVSFGCTCYQISENLKMAKWKRPMLPRIVTTLLEAYAVYVIVLFSVKYKAGPPDFICILLEAVILVGEFSGLSLLNSVAGKLRTGWIEGFTLALYVCQCTWLELIGGMNLNLTPGAGLALYFGVTLLTAVVFVWLIKCLRWLLSRIKTHGQAA